MNMMQIIRFESTPPSPESPAGWSRFSTYYKTGLPSPQTSRGRDPELWNAMGDCFSNTPCTGWYFGFQSLEQAAEYMKVGQAIDRGHLVRYTVRPGGVRYTSTQVVFDPDAVVGREPVSPDEWPRRERRPRHLITYDDLTSVAPFESFSYPVS